MQEELHSDFLKDANSYPATCDEAFSLLLNHKKAKNLCEGKGKTNDSKGSKSEIDLV